MSFRILGLGTALPQHGMSQQAATALAQQICCRSEEQSRLLNALYRKAGVQQRYTALPHTIALEWAEGPSADNASGDCAVATAGVSLGPTTSERMQFYEDHAWPLAQVAAERALAQAELLPDEITHLVSVSCTGFAAPGVDVELMRRLGLRPTVERVNVGFMGCHGAINGLRVAQAIAGADPQARILLAAVELCSLHYRFQWDPERFVGNVLFGDGAAALAGGGVAENHRGRVIATGSCLLPDSTDAMSWRIGDNGFEMTLSPRVPDLIRQHLRPWLTAWLGRHQLRLSDVGSWAVHPGGPRILNAVEESLGLPREATQTSRQVLAEYGNMSSPTVLFILDRLRRAGAPGPCVLLGFGPGLVAEAALVE